MKGWPAVFTGIVLLWLAAVLEQGLADRMAVFGVAPNFLLVVLGPMALLSRPSVGGTMGFFAGLIQGALAGANLTHYVISRALAGFLTSLGNQLEIRLALVVAGLACAATTFIAQVLLMFLAPPSGSLIAYLFGSLGMALYNGLLAIPLYSLLRRWFGPTIVLP
ncbi:MAG: rod shape-determining protein MreD [Fimbriimonadaceae bacterium]|nr:rod shape-determining protein MreD [Fimbriimonadaceae bacterium]